MPSEAVLLYVQPRASRSEVAGRHGESIKIRLRAPPVDGAANAELVRFLAKRFRVPRSAVRLLSGATSRHKRVTIDGVRAADITRGLLHRPGHDRCG